MQEVPPEGVAVVLRTSMFLPVAAALALTAAAEAAAPKPNIIFVLAGEPLPEKPSSQDGTVGPGCSPVLGSALRAPARSPPHLTRARAHR